jgi:hypothetical protein
MLNMYTRRRSSSFSDINDIEKHDDVCICSINIENFKEWCVNKSQKHIFDVMIKFNLFICNFIDNIKGIDKIDLVKDKVLLVGGMNTDCKMTKNRLIKKMLLNVCFEIRDHEDYIKTLFGDDSIFLRIGLHKGTVYRDSLNYPKKMKIFGEDIHVAKYLDSVCKCNSINVSSSVYELIKSDKLVQKLFRFRTEYYVFESVFKNNVFVSLYQKRLICS